MDEWRGSLVTETDEMIAADFFRPDALPAGVPDDYQEVLADLEAYAGQLIVK